MDISKVTIILFLLFLFVLKDSIVLAQVMPSSRTISIVLGASNPNTLSPFNPSPINLPKGNTVVWTNNDTALHTVTSFTHSFDSGILSPNQSFEWTFSDVGYYSYYCRLHPYMTGVITVS